MPVGTISTSGSCGCGGTKYRQWTDVELDALDLFEDASSRTKLRAVTVTKALTCNGCGAEYTYNPATGQFETQL